MGILLILFIFHIDMPLIVKLTFTLARRLLPYYFIEGKAYYLTTNFSYQSNKLPGRNNFGLIKEY